MIPGGPGGSAVAVGGRVTVADGTTMVLVSIGRRVWVGGGGTVLLAVGRLVTVSTMPVGVSLSPTVGRQADNAKIMMKITKNCLIFIFRLIR
jgi:hypothetical protein